MSFRELFAGGECAFPRRGGRARFTFYVSDLARAERLFEDMYVELSVRARSDGGLAFCLDVPDRDLGSWLIPLHDAELLKLGQGPADCEARLRADGGTRSLDLSPFCVGLRHDWSGGVARAFCDLARGDVEGSARRLAPLVARRDAVPGAHHLLGRCHRAAGRLSEAIACYREAVRACAGEDGKLRPWAAAPLSDMGVAYKKQGDAARAVHCFLHSLHLRPNHPEALLSFFSLMALDDTYVLFGAARVLALGGGPLVDQFLSSYAEFAGKDPAGLRARAEELAPGVDLGAWPFRRAGFGRLASFERGLESTAAAAVVRPGRWGPGPASA